jgi:hypothetical protein
MTRTPFPAVSLIDVEDEAGGQFSALREITPLFDRQPYGDWCALFRAECEKEFGEDWKGAGFVSCPAPQVADVRKRLEDATSRANHKFADFLDRAAANQPKEVAELRELEGINSASTDGGAYRCGSF